MSSDWAYLILLLGFLFMLVYKHWVKLWSFFFCNFCNIFSSRLDYLSNTIYRNGNMVQAVSLTYLRFVYYEV